MKRYVPLVVMVFVLIGLALTVGPILAQEPDQDGPDAVPVGEVRPQEVMGTAFTYQGQLKSNGSLVNDTCDFEFKLYDAESSGNQVESTVPKNDVSVSDGLFTVQLDFGTDAFNGDARWLDIAVRCTGDTSYTILTPRQRLTPTPYALYAASTVALQGHPITITVPISPGQVLGWDGDQWVPMDVGDNHHDHWGETWNGSGTGLTLAGGSTGLSGSGNDYGVYGSGNSGVYGTSPSFTGYGGFFVNTGGGLLLAANDAAETSELEFKVDASGEVYADGTYHATEAADLAETMDADQAASSYEPGDVLVVNGQGLITLSNGSYATNVVGVYSTKPAFLARAGHTDNQVPVALVGVVPVKASAENGPIVPGDLLTTSNTPGHAMRAGDNPPLGTVVGKALKPLAEGTGVIEMLVMLQ